MPGSIGSVGLAGIVAGAIAGGIAIAKDRASDAECPNELCSDAGYTLNEQARRAATAADMAFAIGAPLFAGGVVMVLVPSGAGASLSARW
jgi:hypothetical protein